MPCPVNDERYRKGKKEYGCKMCILFHFRQWYCCNIEVRRHIFGLTWRPWRGWYYSSRHSKEYKKATDMFMKGSKIKQEAKKLKKQQEKK